MRGASVLYFLPHAPTSIATAAAAAAADAGVFAMAMIMVFLCLSYLHPPATVNYVSPDLQTAIKSPPEAKLSHLRLTNCRNFAGSSAADSCTKLTSDCKTTTGLVYRTHMKT